MNIAAMKTYIFIIIQSIVFTSMLGNVALAANVDTRVIQAVQTGHAKVILALNLPETPNRLRAARAAMVRDPIGDTQESVLNSLPAGSYELTYQYSYVPSLAMTVTPESLEILKNHPQVKYIQFDELEHIALAEAVPLIKANQVQSGSPAYNGLGVTVAVLDTGINTSHSDFNDVTGRITAQVCFLASSSGSKCPPSPFTADTGSSAEDGNGHGSHVSGIIAANGVNHGVAPGAKIAAVKVCSNSGGCQASDSLAGLNWVFANHSVNNIKVVNMSIASSTLYSDSCDDDVRKVAVDFLINAGITVFAAAGNDGGTPNGKSTLAAPACLSNTIAVGATHDTATASSLCPSQSVLTPDTAACFSNSSPWLDILAPGSKITSSWIGTTTATQVEAGTSMATPMASGVAALMLQKNPALTPAQIKAKLKKTGVNVTDTNGITRPRINALAAVNDANTTEPVIEMLSSGSYLINQEKFDFGWTTTGDPVTKTITLKNAGTATLNLTSSSISSGFSVIAPFPTTISAGAQQPLQIKLDATAVGDYTGTLQFTTNDSVTANVQLNLTGKVCNMQTVPFSENFESGAIPNCWRVISNDSSIRDWGIYGSPDISVISGTRSAAVTSATPTSQVDDDWLILPRITLGNNSQLQFKARDEAGHENFKVRLSTTSNNLSDFTTTIATVNTTATATVYSYPLSGYAGQKIYLAIQNISPIFNSDSLVIDDVSITDSSSPNYQNGTPTTSNLTNTGFDLTVRLDEIGKTYYVVLPDNAAAAPDTTQVKSGQDSTGATANVKASGFVDVTAAGNDFYKTIIGLAGGTAYKIYVVSEDTSANLQTTVTLLNATTTTDTTPPNFNSTPIISAVTTSSFTLTINSNETGKAYYVVLPSTSSAPNATDIKAEQTVNGTIASTAVRGTLNVTANTNLSQAVTGLAANTSYKTYVVLEDVALNLQTAATAVSVTTSAVPDTAPPNFNSTPTVSTITTSGFTLTINSNETGKAYYMVLPSSSSIPNAATVKAGGNFISITAANSNFSKIINGLAANTSYKIYVVLEDTALNLQPTVTTINATTTAIVTPPVTPPTPAIPPNYTVVERKEGTGTGQISSIYVKDSTSWTQIAAFTATPDPGSVFVKWTGNAYSQDCYSDQATVYVKLNAIKTCTATFDKITADNQSLVPVKLAAYYLPGTENSGKALIRITNTNVMPVTVNGTLYHASGQLLGIANSILIPTLAPQATMELTTTDLAKLCKAPAWTGLAWLHITTPNGLKMLNLLENDNKMISNFSTIANDNVLYNLPASTSSEQANIVLINTGDNIQSVTATLYSESGQILGRANAVLADVAARGIFIISIKQLELLVGATPWTDHVAKLHLTNASNTIKMMSTLLSSDATVTNLTPTHDNAVFNLPGATNLDQAFVYISNTTDSAMSVRATLYHQDGYLLGNSNTIIINNLAPQATQMLSVSEVEKLFNVPTWEKRARLMITAPTTGIKVTALIYNGFNINNLSTVTSNQMYYLPDATNADKAYIRIANVSDLPVTVTGVIYAENGQMLGSGTLVPSLAAQTIAVFSMPMLGDLLKVSGWTGKARLVLNPSGLQVMSTLRSSTGQLLDMSDIAQE